MIDGELVGTAVEVEANASKCTGVDVDGRIRHALSFKGVDVFFVERVEFLLLRVVHGNSSVVVLGIEYVRNYHFILSFLLCRVAAPFNKSV